MFNRLSLDRLQLLSRVTAAHSPTPRRARLIWTIGNLLMLAGIYLLFYVGGMYVQIDYQRLAARGDSDIPADRIVMISADAEALQFQAEPPVFNMPVFNNNGQVYSDTPPELVDGIPSTVDRIVIPGIDADSKVVEVGWTVEEQAGAPVAVWEVAEYAVGHHKGSANPGDGGNVVLAGHVGGYGKVFKDLFYVETGDQLSIYSNGQQYLYVVRERLVLDEEGVTAEQRAANARYIQPTDSEMVTLVTCWPPTGPDRFTQRVVVRATPFGSVEDHTNIANASSWAIR